MTLSLSTQNTGEIDNTVVKEHFLVELGFSTPVRLSSRDTVTFDGNTYTGVAMNLSLKMDGSGGQLSFLDENFTYISNFMSERAGVTCKVWALYGATSDWSAGDEDLLYEGEIGRTAMRDTSISFPLVNPQSKYICDILVTEENGFNHLPPDGIRFETGNGIIVLERSK